MENSALIETIYRHSKRDEWGHAIEAWREDDRIAYVFEDGKTRTFHRQYARFLEPVDRSCDRATAIIRNLRTLIKTRTPSKSVAPTEPTVTLDEQVALFKLHFNDGFGGDLYQREHRGRGAKRSAKRHRDVAVALAASQLSLDRLRDPENEDGNLNVVASIVRVLEATDLAPKREVDAMRNLSDTAKKTLGAAAMDLLFGEDGFAQRFNGWLRVWTTVTGHGPSWELATSLPALVEPSTHVAVKGSVFREQAKWMAPNLVISGQPTAAAYERLQEMAERLADQLRGSDVAPKDLLDVRDFIWLTLRPSAREEISAMRAKPSNDNGGS